MPAGSIYGPRYGTFQRFVVPATFGIAAGGHAGLPQHMRPGLAADMCDGERIFDGNDVIVVEHGAADFGLEDHDATPTQQGRDLLEDVAHGGVALAMKFILAALGDGVNFVHDGGDRGDKAVAP